MRGQLLDLIYGQPITDNIWFYNLTTDIGFLWVFKNLQGPNLIKTNYFKVHNTFSVVKLVLLIKLFSLEEVPNLKVQYWCDEKKVLHNFDRVQVSLDICNILSAILCLCNWQLSLFWNLLYKIYNFPCFDIQIR